MFANELGGRAFGSYDEAIASPDVDAVAVVTPPSSHKALALAALIAGKHVVLEKPPTATAAEIDELEVAAQTAGKQVFVAENYHYKPLLLRLRSLLAEGVIGDVLFIQVNAIKKQAATNDWRDDPALALGGAPLRGRHPLDRLHGEPRPHRPRRPRPPAGAGSRRERGALDARHLRLRRGCGRDPGVLVGGPVDGEGPPAVEDLRPRGSITFETNGLWVVCRGKKFGIYLPDCVISRAIGRCGPTSSGRGRPARHP